jgi:hypothetical protein
LRHRNQQARYAGKQPEGRRKLFIEIYGGDEENRYPQECSIVDILIQQSRFRKE